MPYSVQFQIFLFQQALEELSQAQAAANKAHAAAAAALANVHKVGTWLAYA